MVDSLRAQELALNPKALRTAPEPSHLLTPFHWYNPSPSQHRVSAARPQSLYLFFPLCSSTTTHSTQAKATSLPEPRTKICHAPAGNCLVVQEYKPNSLFWPPKFYLSLGSSQTTLCCHTVLSKMTSSPSHLRLKLAAPFAWHTLPGDLHITGSLLPFR